MVGKVIDDSLDRRFDPDPLLVSQSTPIHVQLSQCKPLFGLMRCFVGVLGEHALVERFLRRQLCRQHGVIRTPEPLSLAEIMAAAPEDGALVLPVLTETTAFAFVIAHGADAVAVIELPGLNHRAVDEHLWGKEGWLGVYFGYFHRRGSKATAALTTAEARWHAQLTAATLAWLWERLLEPLHQYLRDQARLAADAPVVLLAPGLLGLLPLHAAGPGADGRQFGEHWTVSYAPSVRALLTCRQRVHRITTVGSVIGSAITIQRDLIETGFRDLRIIAGIRGHPTATRISARKPR